MARVWFITGCSSGFGRQIAIAAARLGDTVVAGSRNTSKLEDLKTIGNIIPWYLDVRSSDQEVRACVREIHSIVGRIDVLVNNAGYILEGAIEECRYFKSPIQVYSCPLLKPMENHSAEEVEDHFDVNVFGQLRVLRAVLPSMRAHKSGVVANLGSIGGWSGTPAAGLYCATKAAIAIYTEALRGELNESGIKAICIEPGYFRTNFLVSDGGHKIRAKCHIQELASVTQCTGSALTAYNQRQPGDPAKGAQIIVEALTQTGRCQGRGLPPRLALGSDAVQAIGAALDRNREELNMWKDLVATTNCDDVH